MLSYTCLALLCVAAAVADGKRVLLWTTDDAAYTNSTELGAYLARIDGLKDVLDVVSPCSYYIEQTPPHRLVRKPGANNTHAALQSHGFLVQPLVGDISGGWNMSWYRSTFSSPGFAWSAADEIIQGKLEGLNFDYEPHQPGSLSDASAYGSMVSEIARLSGALLTVDFPCDGALCDLGTLVKWSEVHRMMDMSTYSGGSNKAWNQTMHAHMAAAGGPGRYGLGVCPGCSKDLTNDQIEERMEMAAAAGVQEIVFWANVDPKDSVWWNAIRKWKLA